MNDKIDIPDREPDFSVGLPGMNDNCGEQHFWIVECPTAMVTQLSNGYVREVLYDKESKVLWCKYGSKGNFMPEVNNAYHRCIALKDKEIEDILLDANEEML